MESASTSGREFHNRCCSDRVRKIVGRMSIEQKEAVRSVGFGVFLDMKDGLTIHSSLVSFLVNQLDPLNNQLSVHGKKFLLTKDRFEDVMGIKDGGEEINFRGEDDHSDLVRALIGSRNRLIISQLCSECEDDRSAGRLFVVRFVLVVIGTILCPPSAVFLKMSYVALLEDLVGIRKKNWASYSLSFLMQSVHRFKVQKLKYLSGCIMFLQVYLFT